MWNRRTLFVVLATVTLIVAGASAAVLIAGNRPTGLLPFTSYGEMADYISATQSASRSYASGSMFASPASPAQATAPGAAAPGGSTGTPAYSGTNVQVSGVDELDTVKTDGTYLYAASGGGVAILLAYPADAMRVVSRIAVANLTADAAGGNVSVGVTGLFLAGPRLVGVAQAYTYSGAGMGVVAPANGSPGTVLYLPHPERTLAFLFDVSNPAAPVLEHTVSITGWPSTGRMVGGTIYLVATEFIWTLNGTYTLPQLCVDEACRSLHADEVYHDPQSVDAWDYTNLLAVNATSGEARAMSVITGGYSLLYMSPTAMYLAFYKWSPAPMGTMGPLIAVRASSGYTTIYKLRAEGLDIATGGSADVPGSLISQYAMDEWDGDLRVATTTWGATDGSAGATSGVYVFDGAMQPVGSVSGLAPGESIFAVRFLGDRAYVVTYRKIDPLFVIDLADPSRPSVSGTLEMPGFSEYLYPVDAQHLLGLGKDAVPAIEGNWSWYQGLKLALYNVTDPAAPSEVANVTLGDRGTDSMALYDPHAFLYVPGRQYVVVPVELAQINASWYPDGVPSWAWGSIVWQGVYVFRVNATSGITEVGRIAHDDGTVNATCGWYGSPDAITRSLYIGDVLYTVSPTTVMANSLTDLSEISAVAYAAAPTPLVGCGYPGPVLAA